MKTTNPSTPAQANYRVLDLIEQMTTVAPKGASLGLCDTISAMYSSYFIESGGVVPLAIEAFLRQEVKEEKEREARTRRASKAITYGSYNVKELIERLQEIVRVEGEWVQMRVQGYQIVSVDFTAYRRTAVKKLKAKAYDSDVNRAVSAVPICMIASVGKVNEQRIVLLKNVVLTDLTVNDNPLLIGTLLLSLEPQAAIETYAARWPVEGLPQTGKYILSGGKGTQYVHHPTAMQRLPTLSLIFGSLLKYAAATLPAFRTGFWDRARKPTYGRLVRQLKKVGIPLSGQLSKKESVTAHLPVGYEDIRLAKP